MLKNTLLHKNIESIIIEISQKYGTPFYIYSLDSIEEKIELLTDAIGKQNHLYYSVKANPNWEILKLINAHNLGVEISSLGELELVKKIGFLKERIVFSGPSKSKSLLEVLVKEHIRCVNVESLVEIKHIQEISFENGLITDISIRINPTNNNAKTGMKMTGVSSQFGIDWSDLPNVIAEIKEWKNIRVLGIQVYFGTQILNVEDFIANANSTIQMVEYCQNVLGINVKFIDFGGGFGVPYFEGQKELDLVTMKKQFHDIINANQYIFDNVYCIFESGRYLVGESGFYVTSIVDKKMSHGKKYIICDGGSNHHAECAFLGRLVIGNFPISVINKKHKYNIIQKERINVCGALCTPTDIIARNIELDSDCDIGDLIVIEKSGAYGLTSSPLLFISHHLPNEYILKGDAYSKSQGLERIINILFTDKL